MVGGMAASTLIDTGFFTARPRLADVVEPTLAVHETDLPPNESSMGEVAAAIEVPSNAKTPLADHACRAAAGR